MVVFTRSSATTQPEVRLAGRLVTAPPSTLSSSVLIKAGEANYSGRRWGDYSAVAVDPLDQMTLWAAGEY